MILTEKFNKHWMHEPFSGCWLWTGKTYLNGYGSMKINYKPRLAHRVAWEIFKGEIPTGLCVLHRCDIKCCVNPNHLFLGTHWDNQHDRILKSRPARGRVLSENTIKLIRKSGDTQTHLAHRFGVTPSAISRIKSGENRRFG